MNKVTSQKLGDSVERIAYSNKLSASRAAGSRPLLYNKAGKRYPCLAGRQALNAKIFSCVLVFCALSFVLSCFAQDSDLEFSLDVNSATIPLPNIFKPNIDLSGRGFSNNDNWPVTLASKEVLETWHKDIGFVGIYRLQFNLWEITQLAKDKKAQDELLRNYEEVIQQVNSAGGIVLLDIFGTPAGLGKALDKTSMPVNLKAFKELAKAYMRDFSCLKKYNIWYEVWSAPDVDDFLLGKEQEYLNLYKTLAEAAKELGDEYKIYIPIGGPSVSWWFRSQDENNILTPERSLIYKMIKFCAHYNLPLDFISWHAYSADPKAEKEITVYKKNTAALIRDWLSYFHFNKDTPLIISEWNYDSFSNIISERRDNAYVCASYIPSRIKRMYEEKIDYQVYFSLEDFKNANEGIVRNVGIFWLDSENQKYAGGDKVTYNTFRMLSSLGESLYTQTFKQGDDFVGLIPTKKQDGLVVLIYNYIDPEIGMHFLSRNISTLKESQRRILLNLVKSGKLKSILSKDSDISKMRFKKKLRLLLKKAQELQNQAVLFKEAPRNIKMEFKNLPITSHLSAGQDQQISGNAKETYVYQRYNIDSGCSLGCNFIPSEKKDLGEISGVCQIPLVLKPYSLTMIVLKKQLKDVAPEAPAQEPGKDTVAAGSPITSEQVQEIDQPRINNVSQ